MPDPWVSKAEKNAPRSIFGRYLAAGNFQFLKNAACQTSDTNFSERARSEGTAVPTPVIGQSGQTRRFYSSDFSHPISHRTPHYRVGNGVIERQQPVKKAIFSGTERNCKIQGKMGCNGLGNRCSIPELSPHRSTRCLRLVDVYFDGNSLATRRTLASALARGRTHGKSAECKLDEMC